MTLVARRTAHIERQPQRAGCEPFGPRRRVISSSQYVQPLSSSMRISERASRSHIYRCLPLIVVMIIRFISALSRPVATSASSELGGESPVCLQRLRGAARSSILVHHGQLSAPVQLTSFGTPPAAYLPWGYFIDASSKPIVGNCGHIGGRGVGWQGNVGSERVAGRGRPMRTRRVVRSPWRRTPRRPS